MAVKLSEEEFYKRIKEIGTIEVVGSYPGSSMGRTDFKCKTCGHQWNAKVLNIVNADITSRTGCPECAAKRRLVHLNKPKANYLASLLKQRKDGKQYKWLGKYHKDNKEKIEILHKACGQKFLCRPNDFQQGYGCPFCRKGIVEKIFRVYLRVMSSDDQKLIKIGIDRTGHRMRNNYRGFHIDETFMSNYTDEKTARRIERYILNLFASHKEEPKKKFSGFTECFKYSEEVYGCLKTLLIAGTPLELKVPLQR